MAAIYIPGSFPALHSEGAEQVADFLPATNATYATPSTHTHHPHSNTHAPSPHNGIMDHASSNTFTHTPPRSFTAKRKRAQELPDSDDRCSSSDAARQPARFSMLTNIPQRFWDFSSNVVTGFLDLFRTRQAPEPHLKTTIESVPTDSSGRKRRAVDVTPTSRQTRLPESDAPQMSALKSPAAAPTPVLPNITEDREKIRARWHREYFGSANVDRMRPKQQKQQPSPTYKPTTHTKSIPFRDRQISGLIAKAHKAQGGSFAQKAAQKAAAEREAAEKAAAEQAAAEEAARIEAEKEAARVRAEEEARARAEEEAARAKEEAARAKAVIVELPEDIIEELQVRMSGSEKDRDTLIQLGSIPIQKISFKRILAADKHGTDSWLDDDAVNAWYNSIVDAKKRKDGYVKSDTNPPTFANLQTAWYEKVSKEGAKGLKRWMKRAGVGGTNILKCERIFLPINMGSHWTLLIINGKDKSIEYLDSMGGGGEKYFKIARELLRSELGDKYEDKAWHNLTRNRSSPQSNMNDCGVFTCLNGLAAAKERSYKEVTAQQMPMARRMMAGVFLNGGFEGALDSVLDV